MPDQKTIYLHIGQDKAGSTAIQQFLHRNCPMLGERGYDLVGGRVKHHGGLYASVMGSRQEELERAVASIRESSSQNHIVSYEGFYGMTGEKIEELLSAFEEFRVVVIFYVRRRSDKLRSGVAESLKLKELNVNSGAISLLRGDFEEMNAIRKPAMDYLGIVRRWQALLDERNSGGSFILRVYEKSSMASEDLLTDFCRAIGVVGSDESLQEAGFRLRKKLANRSISPTGQYLSLFAELLQPTQVQRRDLLDLMVDTDEPGAAKLSLVPDSVVEELDEHYAADDAVLAREFLDREALFQEPPEFKYAEPSGEDFVRLITTMMRSVVLKAIIRSERETPGNGTE